MATPRGMWALLTSCSCFSIGTDTKYSFLCETNRIHIEPLKSQHGRGAQWLSGRVLDSRPRGRGFKPHRRCGPWARHIYPSLVLVQPRKTRPCLTERFLMGHKESNQTNKTTWERKSNHYMNVLSWYKEIQLRDPNSLPETWQSLLCDVLLRSSCEISLFHTNTGTLIPCYP